MTYAQLPRTVDGRAETQVDVRTARAPQGPWSAERLYSLPVAVRTGDCGPEASGRPCQHYFAHPEHARPGGLPFTVVEPTHGGRQHLYEIPDAMIPAPRAAPMP